ncbi:hypothetical protein FRC07_002557 [Ceratobasidium sp. 392]|nr:hypothetical protein FRC07_002557 [Ceratobasidium sp. 392]
MFLSPSVIEIQVARPDDETPSIAMPTSLCLLRHISTIASGVQRLSLFIRNNDDDEREVDPDATWFWEPPLHSSLRSLAALQELTCTQVVLAVETFSVIASLTSLSVLNIWMDGGTSDFWDSPYRKYLPPNPFPALKHFSMRGVDAVDSWFVLGSLAFQNLPSLRLGLEYHPDPDMAGPGDDPWEYELIELIAKTCPRLTELRIDFDEDGRYDEPRNLFAPAERGGDAIMAMSKLPLETLYISSALLGDTCESFPIDSKYCADYLMTAWPQLTRVHLPHFVGHFDSLYEFSQLPNLEELTLRLFLDCFSFEEGNFNYDTDLDEIETGSAPLSTLSTSYMMLLSEVASDLTARALLHFWPNLERIALRLDPDDPVGDYSSILDDLEETNQEIQKLRDSGSDSSSGSSSSSNPSSDGSESSVQL